MGNGRLFANGSVIAPCQNQNVTTARHFRLTIPERGKYILKIGPGDHTSQDFELNKDQLRGLVLDAIAELLR